MRNSTINGSCFLKPEGEIDLYMKVAMPSVNSLGNKTQNNQSRENGDQAEGDPSCDARDTAS